MTNDSKREELIEEAAKAIYETSVDLKFEDADEWNREIVRDEARAALAVFEQAHTPTDDERTPDYTPTTEQIRERYEDGFDDYVTGLEDFDRWLAAHDAEVRVAALAEQEGRRQFTAAYRAANGNVIALDTPTAVREHASNTVAEFADEDPEGPDYFVATRILPPWMPVPDTTKTENGSER